jgi:hypothetical protein
MASDVTTLIRRSARLDVEDLDYRSFAAQALDPDSLRCLRYMHDIEGHTMCYLRDVLVTRAHKDPDVTAFLACWAYEELWHGEAIGQVLEAHGEPSGSVRLEALRRRLPKRDALRPLTFSIGSAVTKHLPAVHMAWGAVNEWTTQSAYGRLAAKADHPVLSELLRRIMRQEGRHIDFYAGDARRRLAASPRAQRLARYALRHFWAPVGSGVMPPEEVSFLARHLFGDEAGREAARRVDRQIDRLPGLSGLNLLESAVDNALRSAA